MAEPMFEPGPERAESPARGMQGRSKAPLAPYLRLRPIRAAVEKVERVYELECAGESEWTPWLAIAGLVVFYGVIAMLMFGIVEGASHLLASASPDR